MAAQPGQQAAAGGPDAADRDAQPGADLGVRQRRIHDEQFHQPPAAGGQVGERLTQGGVTLGREHLLFSHHGLRIGQVRHVGHQFGRQLRTGLAQAPEAFPPGRGDQPAGQRVRVAEAAEVVDQVQPHRLHDVLGVGASEPVPEADRPDQRGVPVDDLVPGPLVAVCRTRHQVGDGRLAGPRVAVLDHHGISVVAGLAPPAAVRAAVPSRHKPPKMGAPVLTPARYRGLKSLGREWGE
jgi:hypothetical protein